MTKRNPLDGLVIIGQRDKTFTDEYHGRDIQLSTTEAAKVRMAAEKLGLRLTRTPTGRTAQMVILQAAYYALAELAQCKSREGRARWWQAYLSAKRAMGKEINPSEYVH